MQICIAIRPTLLTYYTHKHTHTHTRGMRAYTDKGITTTLLFLMCVCEKV